MAKEACCEALAEEGARPYAIPIGGSTPHRSGRLRRSPCVSCRTSARTSAAGRGRSCTPPRAAGRTRGCWPGGPSTAASAPHRARRSWPFGVAKGILLDPAYTAELANAVLDLLGLDDVRIVPPTTCASTADGSEPTTRWRPSRPTTRCVWAARTWGLGARPGLHGEGVRGAAGHGRAGGAGRRATTSCSGTPAVSRRSSPRAATRPRGPLGLQAAVTARRATTPLNEPIDMSRMPAAMASCLTAMPGFSTRSGSASRTSTRLIPTESERRPAPVPSTADDRRRTTAATTRMARPTRTAACPGVALVLRHEQADERGRPGHGEPVAPHADGGGSAPRGPPVPPGRLHLRRSGVCSPCMQRGNATGAERRACAWPRLRSRRAERHQRGVDELLGQQVEHPVELLDRARLAEAIDPDGDDPGAEHRAQPGQRVAGRVVHGDDRRARARSAGRRRARWSPSRSAASPGPRRRRAGPPATPGSSDRRWSGRGRSPRSPPRPGAGRPAASTSGSDARRWPPATAGPACDRPGCDRRRPAIGRPIAPGQHLGPQPFVAQTGAGGGEGRLVERSGRQAQVERVPVRCREAGQPVAQQPVERHRVGRLGVGSARAAPSRSRRDRRLVGALPPGPARCPTACRPRRSGRRCTARRSGRRGRGRRTGRRRCRSAAGARRAARGPGPSAWSVRKRFISLMPSSMWWPGGLLAPAQQPFGAQEVALRLGAEHAHLVDPAAEVGGDADVGRRRHHRRSATSGWLPSAVSRRPNVSWVDTGLLVIGPGLTGMAQDGPGWDAAGC